MTPETAVDRTEMTTALADNRVFPRGPRSRRVKGAYGSRSTPRAAPVCITTQWEQGDLWASSHLATDPVSRTKCPHIARPICGNERPAQRRRSRGSILRQKAINRRHGTTNRDQAARFLSESPVPSASIAILSRSPRRTKSAREMSLKNRKISSLS